jgi:hypothetical protein
MENLDRLNRGGFSSLVARFRIDFRSHVATFMPESEARSSTVGFFLAVD